jgi:methionine biosynthesis protein MetW
MRPDLQLVAGLVGRDVRVVDLGCGDGALLEHLIVEQGCAGHGIEQSAEGFHACVARGVPVTQRDLEDELPHLGAGAFDCAVLSLTLQAMRRPAHVLADMGRVAPRRVVSLPNFGHWRLRAQLALRGRMPTSRSLPYPWYETPNIHLCTLTDFERLVAATPMRIVRRILLDEEGRPAPLAVRAAPNLLAAGAVPLLAGGAAPPPAAACGHGTPGSAAELRDSPHDERGARPMATRPTGITLKTMTAHRRTQRRR